MTYSLEFKKSALKEWEKLGHVVKQQFKKKFAERLENPHVPASALTGAANLYTIKLRQVRYRLVYSVNDEKVTVTVIAVGKRNRNEVYTIALSRIDDSEP